MPETRCKAGFKGAMTWVAAAAIATVAAACGSADSGSAPSPSPTQAASPSHSPSPGVKSFSFKLNPEPTVTATGTITLTASQRAVKIELKITGLQPSSSHISHIHIGGCPASTRGGIAFALNQVVADGQGVADTITTINNITYPPSNGKWYVVVHAGPDMQGTSARYLMCGNLF
jgi:Cu/Zn superoxide dismutase